MRRDRELQERVVHPETPSWPAVRFFREQADLTVSKNRLPHWQQEGACYFLTFRLGDSLPEEKLRRWREERRVWLELHPKPWTPELEIEYHRLFSGKIDRWLDIGHGSCLLGESGNAAVVGDALGFFEGDRYSMHGWVVMPNHVHVLLSLSPSDSLDRVVGSWKRFSARKINAQCGRRGVLWQKDYFDRIVRDQEHFKNVVGYLRRNAAATSRSKLFVSEWVESATRSGGFKSAGGGR